MMNSSEDLSAGIGGGASSFALLPFFVPSSPALRSSQRPHLPGAHPARRGCGSRCGRRRAAATAPPGTCAVATPGRRLQSPPPPPPGSAVTSCSCFPVGPVGLTFESVFSCLEGSAGASCESCAEGGGVEPGQARSAGQTAAGVPGGLGTPTPRASQGFR